ncbi:Biotin carboxyl carrier protein of acetyl-CoA carboxylase, partial [Dysosmobacter welbionis]
GRVGELQLADLQVVALGDLGGLAGLNAVHEDGSSLVLVGHAQVRVDLAQLHVGGVGGVSGLGEGANLNALEAPGVGGTAEVIGGVGGQAQVGEVSLSELHLVVVVDVAVGTRGVLDLLGLVAGDGHGSAVDVDRSLGVVLDH